MRRIEIIVTLVLSVAAASIAHAQTEGPAPAGDSHAASAGDAAPSPAADAEQTSPPPAKDTAPPPGSPSTKGGSPRANPSASAGTSESEPPALGVPPPSEQEQIEKRIAKGGDALRRRQFNDAIDHLEAALALVRDRAPLRARRFLLVKDDATAFGQYAPRGSNVFRPGEEMLFYLEPENYTFRRRGDLFEASLRVDVNLLLPDGTVIYGKRNFFEQVFSARSKIHDLYLNLSLEVSGLEEGVYRVEYVVKDGFSDKQLAVQQDVVIREPEPVYYP